MKRRTKIIIAGATVAIGVGVGTGCSRFAEEYNDAPLKYKNDSPAAVFSQPDGFGNFSEKCDASGNLVITTRSKAITVIHIPDICVTPGLPKGIPTR